MSRPAASTSTTSTWSSTSTAHRPKDYLHRGSRAGQGGRSGTVVTLVTPEQRRDMSRLIATAGVTPLITQVRSGEEELTRITGAQAPSGVPVVISVPAQATERARRSSRSLVRGRRRAPGTGSASEAGRRGGSTGDGGHRGSSAGENGYRGGSTPVRAAAEATHGEAGRRATTPRRRSSFDSAASAPAPAGRAPSPSPPFRPL
ncbi:hypothetical protein SALBM311S_11284 [Streptomyces alboniger]